MIRKYKMLALALIAALLFSGCAMRTVDQMYALPKRSAEYQDLQKAIDKSMSGMEYAAPLSGENRQTVQIADLNGDGTEEYLLFARDSSDDPLKILIFSQVDGEYQLQHSIASRGSAFETVEYVNIDGREGMELVVGRQVSNQVLRYLSVYSFASGAPEQLMAVNYAKFISTDLNGNGLSDLMVISPGASEEDSAVAALYSYEDGAMIRSREVKLSAQSGNIKRIMVSKLHGGTPAVYVASSLAESAIITDVFAVRQGHFTNVSLSQESETSVQTLRNHYVYADDIDNDGTLELPSLINMTPVHSDTQTATQHLILWYAIASNGDAVEKMYTFHNFDGGWYLQLDGGWATRVSVTQQGNVFTFYLWNERFEKAEKLLTVYAMTGADRDEAAQEDGRFILYKTEGVTYAAKLEVGAISCGITEEKLAGSFFLIHLDWMTGET